MGTKNLFKLMSLAAAIVFMSSALAQTVTVGGKFIYHTDNNSPLSGITVTLVNQTNQIIATTVTNSDGTYLFTNVPAGNYTVKGSTSRASLGYTLKDCLTVLMYVNGLLPLNDIQLLSADVDNNNIVDRNDLNLMIAAWARPNIKLPAGDWKFLAQHFTVTGSKYTAPPSDGGPDIPIPPSSGTSTGDVGSVYVPGIKPSNTLALSFINTISQINSSVDLPVKITSSVPATGFGLTIDCPTNFKIDQVIPSISGVNITISGQTITADWLDPNMKTIDLQNPTTLFVIKGKTINTNESSFTLGDNSHLISKSGDLVYSAKIDLPKIALSNIETFAFELKGVWPNPFPGSTNIIYTLPTAGNVEMKIYNIMGQLVATPIKGFQEAGLKKLPFNGNSLQSGVYFCTISLKVDKNYTATTRMVLAR